MTLNSSTIKIRSGHEYEIAALFKDDDILLQGERKFGEYQISIARYTPSGWSATVPPLNLLVTNYRLVLQPQSRRPYPPASIPSTYVMTIDDVEFGQRRGIQLSLKTGHQINMFINWNQTEQLMNQLKEMLISPVGTAFKKNPAENDINRLIRFISGL